MSMIQYMTTYSEAYFDHDTIYDNDGIKRLVPNLVENGERGLKEYDPETEAERIEGAWLGVCSLYFKIIKENS